MSEPDTIPTKIKGDIHYILMKFRDVVSEARSELYKTRNVEKTVDDIAKAQDLATQQIQNLINEAVIAELERLKSAHSINIFDEYTDNRIKELKSTTKEV